MFDCCQETASIRSQYADLETILNNFPQAPQIPPMDPKHVPKLSLSLDLPGYAEYLPTYWPGQNISGQLKIHLVNNVKVSHIRIALFGNVQVYGKYPGDSMANGLFDYQKNEQLINTGVRIIGGCTLDQGRNILQCKRDVLSTNKIKVQKAPEDRHIERLIRRVTAINHTTNTGSGILNDATCNDHKDEASYAFELNVDSATTTSNTVDFSIRVPTSRRLSGTFDHPHYPISYRIVAIMKCKDHNGNQLTCYSTVRIRLEPFMDIYDSEYKSPIQSNSTRCHVYKSNTIFSDVCNSFLTSSSILKHWLQKITLRKILPSTHYHPYFLESHLELPKQAFERSHYIPLKLKFLNHAAIHFKISAIKIQVEFLRRIHMTCSINEEVECKAIQSNTVIFKNSDEEMGEDSDVIFFRHTNMTFDLSRLIQVPDDCTCTITCASTRDIFSLGYDLNVKLDITGVAQQRSSNPLVLQEPCYYYANDHNFVKQEEDLILPKEPYHYKFKTYTLQLEPIAVIVGNSGYQNNNNL